jgi:hypothetical protein
VALVVLLVLRCSSLFVCSPFGTCCLLLVVSSGSFFIARLTYSSLLVLFTLHRLRLLNVYCPVLLILHCVHHSLFLTYTYLPLPTLHHLVPHTAILFARAGANLIISARRPDALSAVKKAVQEAHQKSGVQAGGKVFEWVQDVQDRRGVDSAWSGVTGLIGVVTDDGFIFRTILSFLSRIHCSFSGSLSLSLLYSLFSLSFNNPLPPPPTELFETLPEEFRKIDVLVNNAGLVYGREPVGQVDEQEMDIMFQTNVLGLIHLVRRRKPEVLWVDG